MALLHRHAVLLWEIAMSAGDWKRFYQAVCEGDLRLVQHYVDAGIDVNYAHPEFFSTPLVAAIRHQQEQVALLIFQHGADPQRISDIDGISPLEMLPAANLPALTQQIRAAGFTHPPRASWWKRWLGW